MSPPTMPYAYLRLPLLLAVLAGCQDPTSPPAGMQPRSVSGALSTWTVNSLADPGNGVCDGSECTLREAIAVAASGDKIVFAGSLQGDIPLTAGELSIDKSLTIDGAGRIAVDAQRNSRVVSIGSAQSQPSVTLAGLTLKNGHADRGAGLAVGISSLTLDGVTLSQNEATLDGGGLYVGLALSVNVLNSTIANNIAAGDGGGIDLSSAGSPLTLINSTVSGNRAGYGGGLFISSGEVTVGGTTISGNSAGIGGGVVNGNPGGTPIPAGGILRIRSSTITANAAAAGGAGVVHGGSGGNRTTLANTIVAGNQGPDCSAPSGGFSSLGHNLGVGCSVHFTAAGDVIVQGAQVFTEVLETELGDNGGPTHTHALIARGRAADAGYCPGETADQRGFARPVDDQAMPNALDSCDIGAYELQGPVAIVADLMISQAVNKTSVKQGELLTYSIRVQNLGPETAPNVVVTDILPTGATFVEALHNRGTHTAPPRGETGTVTWSVGDMLDQANEVAQITVTVLVKGKTSITNTASVTGDVSDPNAANNSASLRVSVASGSAGKSKK